MSRARRTLSDGDEIHMDDGPEAVALYDVYTKLVGVLTAMQPEKLQTALTALGQALDGNGAEIGATIDNLSAGFRRTDTRRTPIPPIDTRIQVGRRRVGPCDPRHSRYLGSRHNRLERHGRRQSESRVLDRRGRSLRRYRRRFCRGEQPKHHHCDRFRRKDTRNHRGQSRRTAFHPRQCQYVRRRGRSGLRHRKVRHHSSCHVRRTAPIHG